MAKGRKTGGRQKGSRNKAPTIREAVSLCFQEMGGMEAFVAWATEHPGDFYTKIMAKLIPTEVAGSGEGVDPLVIEVTHRRAAAPHAE